MIKHNQTDLTQEKGNCLQACVATLLGLTMEVVPDFHRGDGQTIARLERYLHQYDMSLVSAKPKQVTGTYGTYAIAAVPSQRYEGKVHAVIVTIGKGQIILEHDPNPETRRTLGQPIKALRLYFIVPNPKLVWTWTNV